MVRVEKILFYLLLFCLPFQTRLILKEWFFRRSLGGGGGAEFNEWNSAFLYLTDLFILAILSLWFYRSRISWLSAKHGQKINIILGLFFALSALSLSGAQNSGLGIYQLIKLAEFIFLFLYLKNNFTPHLFGQASSNTKERKPIGGSALTKPIFLRASAGKGAGFKLNRVYQVLIASGLLQSFIAIWQFAFQKDLGLRILGESFLSPNIEGAAKIVVSGTKMLRAYGTFPHPNVLAAFLLFSIFSFYFFYLKFKKPSLCSNLISLSVFTFLTLGLFLTFSRIPIILFFFFSICLFLVLFFKKKFYKLYHSKTLLISSLFLFAVILCVALMLPEFYSRFVEKSVDPGIHLRYFYNFISLSMLKENPFFGQGIGNFVWKLQDFQGSLRAANLIYKLDVPEIEIIPHEAPSWLFQPAHNVYLLIAAEIGVVGALLFLVFLSLIIVPLIKIIKENNLFFIFYFLFFIFLALSLFDHFFWTLQQGRLMFWILCGILASFSLDKKISDAKL
ncbi:MAG: hypothetical protein COV69_02475 [Parcubacteria group bacterium CG11_big_fil_rev_8_21_14_0_20_39_14]|nr:MAG: hypothetical protein COV69_02475 [Parcubacteria group bacterium CG11_big_fil_rev_8_21_14_0_20_39_14]PIS35826.1 MAG: hypothetical protein COT36_00370 [Parcubacteria group bacterium CG08_land_8_20_14_0_20_38_56]